MTYNEFLQEACPLLDLAWRKYRRKGARHRLDARMKELGISTYNDYLDLLRADPAEAERLPYLMLVTVTRFFREQKGWRDLTEVVIPEMLSGSGTRKFRAWSAGCCGGEEPYSLAISWLEYLQPHHLNCSIEIIATDIDDASLDRAGRAIYQKQSLRELPEGLRDAWFTREDSLWSVSAEARSVVTFDKKNLLTDPPPQDLDLVLCRYLAFTYFRGERLMAAVRKLWGSLRPGGVLMIGAKESLPDAALELFEPMDLSHIFYRRRG